MVKFMMISLVTLCCSVGMARQSTVNMTCDEARSTVDAAGALVLGTGGRTYDRFVRNRSFCRSGQEAVVAYAPTTTSSHCFIGYTCEQQSDGMVGSRVHGPQAPCREGLTQIITEYDENDNAYAVRYVCRGGQMVAINPRPQPAPIPNRPCREGLRQILTEYDQNDNPVQVRYVCRGGTMVRVN